MNSLEIVSIQKEKRNKINWFQNSLQKASNNQRWIFWSFTRRKQERGKVNLLLGNSHKIHHSPRGEAREGWRGRWAASFEGEGGVIKGGRVDREHGAAMENLGGDPPEKRWWRRRGHSLGAVCFASSSMLAILSKAQSLDQVDLTVKLAASLN